MDAQSQSIQPKPTRQPTIGSLFAGIGGFDLGFEQAGFTTKWQVEINDTCRAVLADRFPHAKQFADVRTCLPDLSPVDVIVAPIKPYTALARLAVLLVLSATRRLV